MAIKINLKENKTDVKNFDIETLKRCFDADLCRLDREMGNHSEMVRLLRKLDEKCPCER